jgi:hypothetical protein
MLRFRSAIAIAPLGHPISFDLMLSSLAVAACSKAVETAARPAPVRVQQVSLTALLRRPRTRLRCARVWSRHPG